MTKDLKTIDLNLLPIETLSEMANEAGEQVENNAKLTVQKAIDCGRYLTAIKEQLEHGQWGGWLGANWNYNQKTAQRYMEISNSTCVSNLKDATSINEALRIIADSKEGKTTPRSARKPANVVVSIPETPEKSPDSTIEKDNDPSPNQPTQRKTAKGSEKVKEGDKPRTQQVPVEIVDEIDNRTQSAIEWMHTMTLEEVCSAWFDEEDVKSQAKQLRKLADKLDPPNDTKPTIPPASALRATLDLGTMSEEMAMACVDWIRYKQNNPDKAYRYKTVDSWKKDLKRILKVATQSGEPFVIESLDKAESKGWRGWEQNEQNGKANGNGYGTTKTQDSTSCLGTNGRPRVERAKINYK